MDPQTEMLVRALSGAQPDPAAAAQYLAHFAAPGITDYLTKQPPPSSMTPNAVGKVPSSNPYERGALVDTALLGASAAGLGAGAPAALRGAAAVGRMLPESALDAMTVGGAATAGVTPAGATTLGPKAAQKVEMQREQAQIEAQKAKDAAALEQQQAQQKAALELQTKQQQFEQQQAQTKAAAEAQRQADIAKQNAPFREKYPTLTQALPLIGMGVAGGVPYASRGASILENNAAAKAAQDAVERSNAVLALKGVTKPQLAGVQREMKTTLGQLPQSTKAPVGSQIASSLAGADIASMTPSEYDATMLPPGDPNREAARQQLTDPYTWASRLGPALAGAGAIAKLGGYLPVPIRQRLMPTAQMEGIAAQAARQLRTRK